ncbi:MAG: DsbA family oxidoreductase [Kiloniellales bacterium]
MRIDIFLDTVCPWCFIGKRRLERALQERPQADLTVRWRAFQLNPDMPREGMDRQRYLETKFGGRENAQAVYEPIIAAGQSEGIDFNISEIRRTPNTLRSHRLIHFADSNGKADPVVEALFRCYFLEGRDIGALEVLSEVAGDNDLDLQDALAAVDRKADEADPVLVEDVQARQAGINGVPCFIFNGRYALPGAHTPEIFFQIFDLLREEEAKEAASA